MKVLLVLSAVVACALAQGTECPRIVKRAEWGGRLPLQTKPINDPPQHYVIIHHGLGASCKTEVECSERMRFYQDTDMDANGMDEIQWSFLIGEDGNAYEGRGWDNYAEHASMAYNRVSIGIAFIGTFENTKPNAAALATAQQLLTCGITWVKLRNDYVLMGHLNTNNGTTCPGAALEAEIRTWPHFCINCD